MQSIPASPAGTQSILTSKDYTTAYTGAVLMKDGQFDHFEHMIGPLQEVTGYWLFAEGYEARAYVIGFKYPEHLLLSELRSGHSPLDVKLIWMPGVDDKYQVPRYGTAKQHLRAIAEELRLLTLPGPNTASVPVYIKDSEGNLFDHRQRKQLFHDRPTSGPGAGFACSRCRAMKRKCDRGRPTCNICLKAGVGCEYPSQALNQVQRSHSHQFSPLEESPPNATDAVVHPGAASDDDIPGLFPGLFEIEDFQQHVAAGMEGTFGQTARYSPPGRQDPAPFAYDVPGASAYALPEYNLTTVSTKPAACSTGYISNIATIGPSILRTPSYTKPGYKSHHPQSVPGQRSPFEHPPVFDTQSGTPFVTPYLTPAPGSPFEHPPVFDTQSGTPFVTPYLTPAPGSPSHSYLQSGASSAYGNFTGWTSPSSTTDPATPQCIDHEAFTKLPYDEGLQIISTNSTLRMQSLDEQPELEGIPAGNNQLLETHEESDHTAGAQISVNDLYAAFIPPFDTTIPMHEMELNPTDPALAASLPCMDCGELEGHSWNCNIGNLKPLNLTMTQMSGIADAVAHFDPEQWREHQGAPPTPEREDHATKVREMSAIIRNEESYKKNPALHGLSDEALPIIWALTTSQKIKTDIVWLDEDTPYFLEDASDSEVGIVADTMDVDE